MLGAKIAILLQIKYNFMKNHLKGDGFERFFNGLAPGYAKYRYAVCNCIEFGTFTNALVICLGQNALSVTFFHSWGHFLPKMVTFVTE